MTKQETFFSQLIPITSRWAASSILPAPVKEILIALVLAQVAIETGWNLDNILARPPVNNLSGIKHHDETLGGAFNAQTREVRAGVSDQEEGFFQMYSDRDAWMRDYVRILTGNSCVMGAMSLGVEVAADRLGPWTAEDRDLMARGLAPKHANYSTDPRYGVVVIQIIHQNRLTDSRTLAWLATGQDPEQKQV